MRKACKVGEVYKTNSCGDIIIISRTDSGMCTVRFDDGTILENIYTSNINKGFVKNPYTPIICDVGYFGIGKYKSRPIKNEKQSVLYRAWKNMLIRAYDKKYQENHTTYKGCSVASEWHNFQNFAKWMDDRFNSVLMYKWCLDKDILVKGNKIYSPETCCLVPSEINKLFIRTSKILNVKTRNTKKGNKYFAYTCIGGKNTYVGCFDSALKAIDASNNRKIQYIQELAEKYKPLLEFRMYYTLINYKLSIE